MLRSQCTEMQVALDGQITFIWHWETSPTSTNVEACASWPETSLVITIFMSAETGVDFITEI